MNQRLSFLMRKSCTSERTGGLPYRALAEGQGILRPNVQIETSVWPLRRKTVDNPVISFIAEAYGRDPELPKIP